MENVAYVAFVNNAKEVLMQLKGKKSDGLFPGQWTLPEGSILNGQLTGELVKGIIEDNYMDFRTFAFVKTYPYTDEKTKKNYTFFVFSRKIHVPLLKITLSESKRIDYVSFDELLTLSAPEIIKKAVNDVLNSA
jgi:hypothetical protein